MQTLKNFLAVMAIIVVGSCQKDYEIDWGSHGNTATATLKDTLGNCSPIVVRGSYTKEKNLSDSNYFLIPILVAAEGNYVVFSNSVNGFSFRDSGVVNNIGSQTIKVKATGKPLFAARTDFTLKLGTSVCTFSVTVTE